MNWTPDVQTTDLTRYAVGPLRPVISFVDFHADMKAANLIEHVMHVSRVLWRIWKITLLAAGEMV